MAMSGAIKEELQQRIKYFIDNGKLLEAQRIEQRTTRKRASAASPAAAGTDPLPA